MPLNAGDKNTNVTNHEGGIHVGTELLAATDRERPDFRREFMGRAAALGVSTALATTMLGRAGLAAEPKKGGFARIGLAHGATTDSLDPATPAGYAGRPAAARPTRPRARWRRHPAARPARPGARAARRSSRIAGRPPGRAGRGRCTGGRRASLPTATARSRSAAAKVS